MILFHVSHTKDSLMGLSPLYVKHAIVLASGRETAKCKAHHFLGGLPDYYTVSPLTADGEHVGFDVVV